MLASAYGGHVFENTVFGELLRAFLARGQRPDIYFFRTASGLEIDFLVRWGGKLYPVEVKRSSTPRPEMAQGIERLRSLMPESLGPGLVILLDCPSPIPLTSHTTAIPFESL